MKDVGRSDTQKSSQHITCIYSLSVRLVVLKTGQSEGELDE